MSQLLKTGSLAVAIVALLALPVLAQDFATLDYVGFAYETGGLPPAEVGDEFTLLAVTTYADDIFGVDLGAYELTFYAYGFIAETVVDYGAGYFEVTYTGGFLEVWRDDRQNADWGIIPPNGTAPSTFGDGTLFFKGGNNSFVLFYDTANGSGGFNGELHCIGGDILGGPCGDCAYTWGGAFDLNSGAQIPEGYDVQIDGQLDINTAVNTETTNFGSVKALYR